MELLAPAGTFDCVLAAVNSGANAVYFAGREFGARSFAGNLTDEEIYRAVDYCHLRGVRAYVTVNTLVYDKEYKDLERFVTTITRAGVDAVIVQDLGVLKYIRAMSPDIQLHASTQMTVHSADGVRELERLGVSRVVLSRELSSDEIRKIIGETSAEAEVFVHGAMCMSYSGQCLMSSIIGGRSGNRGKCAQPCRLPYSPDNSNSKYYLSLKDMSLAEHISDLSDMGVASLKIEGRMKGEGYVSAVVSAYRKLIDENRKPTKDETQMLNRVFYRGGLTDGYYMDNKGSHMFAFDKPDNPYLKNDITEKLYEEKQMPAKIFANFFEGEKPYIKMTCGDVSAEVFGDKGLQRAQKNPITKESLTAQLVKTGGTAFMAESTEINIKGNPFAPLSVINELRRNCVMELEQKILEKYRGKRLCTAPVIEKTKACGDLTFTCSVLSIEQYRAIKDCDFELIYVPINVAEKYTSELSLDSDRIVICPPAILREPVRAQYKERLEKLKTAGFSKVEVSTIDAVSLADGVKKYASYRMNITNSHAFDEVCALGVENVCLSTELNLAQLRDIKKSDKTEIIAYGKVPVMITENCILNNIGKCKCDGLGEIYDRTGAKFTVIRDADICRSVVLNSVPLYMGDKIEDIMKTGVGRLRLMFTTESGKMCQEIYTAYMNKEKCPFADFTRLHFCRGALA